jgi:hypothetical protein
MIELGLREGLVFVRSCSLVEAKICGLYDAVVTIFILRG